MRDLQYNFKKNDNITSVKFMRKFLEKERKGEYLGSTVQVIPHVTDEIKKFIKDLKVKIL